MRNFAGMTKTPLNPPNNRCKRRFDGIMRRATKPFPFNEDRTIARKAYKKRQRELRAGVVKNWNSRYLHVITNYRGLPNARQEETYPRFPTSENYAPGQSEFDPFIGIDLAVPGSDRTVIATVGGYTGEVIDIQPTPTSLKKRGAPPKRSRFVASPDEFVVTRPDSEVGATTTGDAAPVGLVEGWDNAGSVRKSPRMPRKSKVSTD